MKAVFFIGKENYSDAKNKVYGDDVVGRQSLTIRDNISLGLEKEGYYLQIEGDNESIKVAEKLLSGIALKLKGKDADKVVKAIDEQEGNAAEGFGAIFG